MNQKKTRTLASEIANKINEKVIIQGWVHARRMHGQITFLDLRDRTGLVQIVFLPGSNGYESANSVNLESCVSISGVVSKRPEKMINSKIVSGKIELQATELVIISQSEILPFELNDTKNVNEELRLKYRYLDLRSPRMTNNIRMRHLTSQYVRKWLSSNDFIEIETPFLSKSTPEGARDFLVPSRLHPGKFFALPQSPQQYKQLLQIGGFERYFQIVRNMRDEDQRGDRQPEFTQIDIEASFINQEDIIKINENLLISLVKNLFPEKHFTVSPFPRLNYDDVMKRYQTDRPDLRKNKSDPDELAAVWIVNFPMFEKKEDGSIGPTHHPFTGIAEDVVDNFESLPIEKIKAQQYDLVINGNEVAGGSIRTYDPNVLSRIFKYLGHNSTEIKNKFGHLLTAFKFGVPPHGGIAWGYDRLMMILLNEKNIREVISFPKTGEGFDPLMDSPTIIDNDQLKEINIKIIK